MSDFIAYSPKMFSLFFIASDNFRMMILYNSRIIPFKVIELYVLLCRKFNKILRKILDHEKKFWFSIFISWSLNWFRKFLEKALTRVRNCHVIIINTEIFRRFQLITCNISEESFFIKIVISWVMLK